jgi:sugar phosphate permease
LETSAPTRRRWLVLAIGLGAMTAGCAFQYGLPYLIPALRADGLSLGEASALVVCPMAGLTISLIPWGVMADRWGERVVLGTGLAAAGAALLGAAAIHGVVPLGACLVLAGAGGGSVHAASGRLILGWFSPRERGLAMGVRQTAQPLGVALAAVCLPALAAGGLMSPLLALAGLCLLMSLLVVLLVRDPVRPDGAAEERAGSPYGTPVLWRLHASSALLVVPQFAVATFALVYLVDDHHWDVASAGRVLAVVQLCGALGRIGVGLWSDRAGSRLRPYRLLAVLIGAVMLALAASASTGSVAAIGVLLLAAVMTMSPNGLAFTAVAEYAGRSWAGRALGTHNTLQNAFAVATPPVLGAVVGGAGYAAAFAAVVAFPLAAAVVTPVSAEHPHRRDGLAVPELGSA